MVFDKLGNLYIGDNQNGRIRKVDSGGNITTFAGIGIKGNSGDGGQASLAELNVPAFFSIDTLGNFYISDEVNNNIRKINNLGIISTISNGSGIYEPEMIALDKAGNLYVADYGNNRIIMGDNSGIYTTIVGTGIQGYGGDGGAATAAKLNEPFGIAFDVAGNLYITDWNNSVIRKVSNVGQTTGINRVTDNINRVILYPNPASTMFQISGIKYQDEIKIYDVLGNEVISTQAKEIDISSLPNGVYFLNVKTTEGVLTKKIIVQH